MLKESENFLLYKKITTKFSLLEKNYLYLGSYLISIEIVLQNKAGKGKDKGLNITPKKSSASKLNEIHRILSESEY